MDLQTVEAVVRRLFSDAEFQATAIASPQAAFAAFDLRSDERDALTKLCARLGSGEEVVERSLGYWI